MSAPAKPKYRTTNWKDYNTALKARGSLLIRLDEDMPWNGGATGKRGRKLQVRAAILNRLTRLGTPTTVPVTMP